MRVLRSFSTGLQALLARDSSIKAFASLSKHHSTSWNSLLKGSNNSGRTQDWEAASQLVGPAPSHSRRKP